MSDSLEYFKILKEIRSFSKKASLEEALKNNDGGWTKHTSYHWSRFVLGKRLNYYPTTGNVIYDNKKVITCGDVYDDIKNIDPFFLKENELKDII